MAQNDGVAAKSLEVFCSSSTRPVPFLNKGGSCFRDFEKEHEQNLMQM